MTNLTNRQKATYARRLLKLADYLAALPRKQYDHNSWGEQRPGCGTVACAFGHAAASGLFRSAGLRYVRDDRGFHNYEPRLKGDDGEIRYDEELGCYNAGIGRAARTVFGPGIYDEVFVNFGEWRHTPKQVARRIRQFVKQHYGDVVTA